MDKKEFEFSKTPEKVSDPKIIIGAEINAGDNNLNGIIEKHKVINKHNLGKEKERLEKELTDFDEAFEL